MRIVGNVRKIVKIDEQKCDGCGGCVPSCAEGAIRIVDGKAKLVADRLCDGLGACLGHCPKGAITIDERSAEEFDHAAVAAMQAKSAQGLAPVMPPVAARHAGGCPGSRVQVLERAAMPVAAGLAGASQLRQWPVQLALLPMAGPIWQDADVLLAADCVPFAYPDFHAQLLSGKTLAIACPKLDETSTYISKLTMILKSNTVRSITIARMEVPCCYGLVRIVQEAIKQAGVEVEVKEVVIGTRGGLSAGPQNPAR